MAEHIKNLIKAEQQLKKSNTLSTPILVPKANCYEMTAYNGTLTKRGVAEQTVKIKSAFPDLPEGFYMVLYDQIKKIGFDDRRLEDAVDYVIRSCEFPKPTVAKFLSWNQKIELFTYEQICNKNSEFPGIMSSYKSVRIGVMKKPMWAHVNDIEKYGLDPWNKTKPNG